MIKIDIDKLTNIIEIPLEQEPNYSFDIYLVDKSYKVQFRTFVNNDTRLSIFQDNNIIVNLSPINIYMTNLAYYSEDKKIVFFFLRNSAFSDEPTFLSQSENDLRLFYANI